jgi:hypothetical protein
LKCDKCGYVSFDYNLTCPFCSKDLGVVRNRLGIHYEPPEVEFEEFFTGGSGAYQGAARPQAAEAELDLDAVDDEFEFTLDD